MTPDGLHMLIALPRLDSDTDPTTLPTASRRAKQDLAQLYGDRRAPQVRMLPLGDPARRGARRGRASAGSS